MEMSKVPSLSQVALSLQACGKMTDHHKERGPKQHCWACRTIVTSGCVKKGSLASRLFELHLGGSQSSRRPPETKVLEYIIVERFGSRGFRRSSRLGSEARGSPG